MILPRGGDQNTISFSEIRGPLEKICASILNMIAPGELILRPFPKAGNRRWNAIA